MLCLTTSTVPGIKTNMSNPCSLQTYGAILVLVSIVGVYPRFHTFSTSRVDVFQEYLYYIILITDLLLILLRYNSLRLRTLLAALQHSPSKPQNFIYSSLAVFAWKTTTSGKAPKNLSNNCNHGHLNSSDHQSHIYNDNLRST